MKPSDKVKPWKAEPALSRIESCRAMLILHGFISEAENQRIKRRIKEWEKQSES